MMETLASWFAQILGELANYFISLFMEMMNVDLATMAGVFPLLITGYRMFQAIGIGLIIGIAVYQLLRFFGGQLVDYNDTPARILVRAFIAGMMLWFGGYLINMVVDLAALPYRAFVENDLNPVDFQLIGFDDFSLTDLFIDASAAKTAKSGTVIVLYILIMVVILYNLLKLMLEVLQRYLMVGVLAYTSPLAFATITSKSTSQIFRSYVNVFLGQCALMGITAWMLRLCISGFGFSEGESGASFRILLTLAMCKIAQRADTYMQSLGVGTVTTTAGLLDDILVGAKTLSGNRNKNSASGTGEKANTQTVLGAKAREEAQSGGGFFSNINHPLRHPLRSAVAAGVGVGQSWNVNAEENTRTKVAGIPGAVKNAYNSQELSGIQSGAEYLAKNASSLDPFSKGVAGMVVGKSAQGVAAAAGYVNGVTQKAKDAAAETQKRIAESGVALTPKAQDMQDAGPNSAAANIMGDEIASDEEILGANEQAAQEMTQKLNENRAFGNAREIVQDGKKTLWPDSKAEGTLYRDPETGALKPINDDGDPTTMPWDDVGAYYAENVSQYAANRDEAQNAMNYSLRMPGAAEEFISHGAFSANSDPNGNTINQMAKTAMSASFNNGMKQVVDEGEEKSRIANFETAPDVNDPNKQVVTFTTVAKDGEPISNYRMYRGKQESPDHRAITSKQNTTWYVHKNDNTPNPGSAGGLGNNQPSPDPRPAGGSGGDRPSPKPDRPHQDNPAPDNPSKEGPALGDN